MSTRTVYIKTALVGGANTAVDGIDGDDLLDGDVCHAFVSDVLYAYLLDDDSGAAESSPDIISPDANAGDKRWILQNAYGLAAKAASGVNADITSMTGLDDGGIPVAKVADAMHIVNLKPAVNAAANKLDIFSKSGGAAPDANNPIKVMIPDGTGYTQRTRAAAYLSGTSQIIMADAGGYWSRSSLADEIKTAWLYAIWDGTGIVWALGGYSGFTTVPTTTTAGDDDYFLLEDGSTYTRNAAHYCVAVAKIRYEYNTADAPDHTIQAAAINAPQIIWNPKSDYGYQKNLAADNVSAGDISGYSAVSVVVKQPGKYDIWGKACGYGNAAAIMVGAYIRTGSSTYGSATLKTQSYGHTSANGAEESASVFASVYLNMGDTIHLGASVVGSEGNRILRGDSSAAGSTSMIFRRAD